MQKYWLLWISTLAFCCYPQTVVGQLWCYECNLNLTDGISLGCHDPYHPAPRDNLNACPTNEPHECLKSAIFYDDVLVTIRGCVPSRLSKKYCEVNETIFPYATIECLFCNEYACNRSNRRTTSSGDLVLASVTLVIANALGRILSA